MDVLLVLKKYNLHRYTSVHNVIRDVGSIIDNAPDQLLVSNRLIGELGGTPVAGRVDAGIIARCMMEQAFINRKNYDPQLAYQYALDKSKALNSKMPYLHAGEEKPDADDKSVECHRIFFANIDKKNAAIARIMAEQLDIPVSTASYHATRFRKDIK